MAKKTVQAKDGDLDNLNFDDIFGDLDSEETLDVTGSKNRKPTFTKSKAFAQTIGEDLINRGTSKQFISESLKKNLNPAYAKVFDFSTTMGSEALDLYGSATKELEPAIKDFKKLATQVISKDSNKVPAWMKDVLDGWREQTSDTSRSEETLRNDKIASDLNSLFAQQAGVQAEQNEQLANQQRLTTAIQARAASIEANLLNKMQMSLSSIEQYNTNINFNVSRKSLEVQYRSLFTLQDILKTTIESTKTVTNTLERIQHNTALPDYLKMKNHEFRDQIFRTTVMEAMYGSMLGKSKDILKTVISNTKDFAIKKIQEGVQATRSALQSAAMAHTDMSGAMGDEAESQDVMKGTILGSLFTSMPGVSEKIDEYLGVPVKKAMNKYKESSYYNKHLKTAKKLQGKIVNADSEVASLLGSNGAVEDKAILAKQEIERQGELYKKLEEYKEKKLSTSDPDYLEVVELSKMPWWKKMGKGLKLQAKSIALNTASDYKQEMYKGINTDPTKVNVKETGFSGLNENFFYTKQTDVTINKVIPTFLSKILQELTTIRKGSKELDANDEVRFDHSIGSLANKEQVRNTASKEIDVKDLDRKLAVFLDKSKLVDGVQEYYAKGGKQKSKMLKKEHYNKRLKLKLLKFFVKNPNTSIGDVLNPKYKSEIKLDEAETYAFQKYAGTGDDASGRRLSLKDKDWNHYKDTFKDFNDVKEAIPSYTKAFEARQQNGLGDWVQDIYHIEKDDKNNFKLNTDSAIQGMVSKFGNHKATLQDVHEETYQGKLEKETRLAQAIKNEQERKAADEAAKKNKPNKSGFSKGGPVIGPGEIGKDNKQARIQSEGFSVGEDVELAPGEHVLTADEVQAAGGHDIISKLRDKLDNLAKIVKTKGSKENIDSVKTRGKTLVDEYSKSVTDKIEELKKNENVQKVSSTLKSAKDNAYNKFHDKYTELGRMEGILNTGKTKLSEFGNKLSEVGGVAKDKAGSFIDQLKEISINGNKILDKIEKNTRASLEINMRGAGIENKKPWLAQFGFGKDKVITEEQRTKSIPDRIWGAAKATVGGAVGMGASLLKNSAKASWFMTKTMAKLPVKLAASALGLNKSGDVYVEGENTPRLTARKVKNGFYMDKKTGRIITKFKDITGEVIETKSGETILEEDEFDKVYVVYKDGLVKQAVKGVFSLAGKAASTILGAMGSAFGMSLNISGMITRGIMAAPGKILKGISYLLDTPCDIYIKDENGVLGKEPILLGKLMKVGSYFSKSSMTPLQRPSKIDGPIVDKDGQVLISEEDFKRGIYNAKGELIKGPWQKVFGFALGAAKMVIKPIVGAAKLGLRLAKGIAKGVWGTTKLIGRGIKGIAKGTFAGMGFNMFESSSLSATHESISILTQIRDILATSTIASKKYRQGAWQNMLGKKSAKETVKGKEDKKDEPGILSKLFNTLKTFGPMLLAGLTSLFTGPLKLITGSLSVISNLVKLVPGVGKALMSLGSKAATFLGGSALAAGGTMLAGVAGVDYVAGKFGVGKDENGEDLKIDEKKDDANWEKMSAWEKIQSGSARGVEKAGSLLFMDNLSNEARAGRIKNESKYLADEETKKQQLLQSKKPSITVAETTAKIGNDGNVETVGQTETAMGATKTLIGVDKLSALDAIRMRQYGLTTLDKDKIKTLYSLEKISMKYITFNGDGVAVFNGNFEKLFSEAKGLFLLSESGSDEGIEFKIWYMKRFMHVYLTHLSAMKSIGIIDLNNVNTSVIDVKKAAKALEWQINAKPWSITNTPWKGYNLNTDASSIQNNVLFLRSENQDTLAKEEAKKQNVNKASESTVKEGGVTGNTKQPNKLDKVAANTGEDHEKAPLKNPAEMGGMSSGGGDVKIYKIAPGALATGAGADKFMKGASLDGLNPEYAKLLRGAIEEYGTTTGKTVPINAAFRSFEQQETEYRKDPSKAAKPGTSLHEFGLAADIDSATLDAMDKAGILRKYGLVRPVSKEPWHLEPVGIQKVINEVKANPQLAIKAIKQGIGKGGSGAGDVLRTATLARRYPDMIDKLLAADSSADATDKGPKSDIEQRFSKTPDVKSISNKEVVQMGKVVASNGTTNNPSQPATLPVTGSKTAGATGIEPEGEKKPTGSSTTTSRTPGKPFATETSSKDNGIAINGNDAKEFTVTGTDKESIKSAIRKASAITGADENLAITIAQVESSMDPKAKASGGSATGLYQFTDAGWKATMQSYIKYMGPSGGLKGDEPSTDVRANILLGTYSIARMKAVKGMNDPVGVYLTHLLGPTGGPKFMDQLNSSPNSPAGAGASNAAMMANKNIFFKQDGEVRTLAGVYNYIASEKIQKSAKDAGVVIGTNSYPENGKAVATATASNTPSSVLSSTSSVDNSAVNSTVNKPTTAIASKPTEKINKTQPMQAAMTGAKPVLTGSNTNTPTSGFTEVVGVLDQQLKVQQDTLKAINMIKEYMLSKKTATTTSVDAKVASTEQVDSTADNNSKSSSSSSGGSAQIPAALVSMARTKFS